MAQLNNEKVKRTGGCACGEIRYGFYEPKIAQFACHCRSCQYAAGGAPAYVVVVRKEEFRITRGIPKEFTVLSEAGNHVTRAFCGTCGTHVLAWSDAQTDSCSIKVGTLDEPASFRPRMHIWMSEAQPWHRRSWFSLRFSRNPPGTRQSAKEEDN